MTPTKSLILGISIAFVGLIIFLISIITGKWVIGLICFIALVVAGIFLAESAIKNIKVDVDGFPMERFE